MDWLLSALLSTIINTFILSLAYFYLFIAEKKKNLFIWSLSWLFYSLRLFVMIIMSIAGDNPLLLMANQLFSHISGILLLYGCYQWINVKAYPKFLNLIALVIAAWIIIGALINYFNIYKMDFFVYTLPTFIFLGGVYIWNGILFFKIHFKSKFGRWLLFVFFIIWGIHKIDYPFIRPIVWLAPWGYLFASLCAIIVAIGIILVYFEQNRICIDEQKNLLSEAQKIAKLGNYTWDVGNNINYWSDELKSLLGCESLETSYKFLLSLVHPDDLQMVIQKGEEARRDLEDFNLDYRIIKPDGNLCYVHDQARIEKHNNGIYMVGTIQDISERKIVEQQIGNLKKFYENILESVEDGICVTNSDDVIFYTNRALEKIEGVDRSQIIGKHILKDYPNDTIANFTPYYEQTKNQLIPVFYEVYKKTLSNRISHQSGWLKPVFENRVYKGVICTIQDTTERKKMEEEIRHSLEEKETLMREINHRVKNNLNVILSLLNFQKENTKRYFDDTSIQSLIIDQFSKIQNRIFSIALTHQLLYKSNDISKIDFHKYLESLINYLISAYGQKKAEINLEFALIDNYPFDLDIIKTLGLIINELVTNSIKYGSDSGKSINIIVRLEKEGNIYLLTIKDNGPGIKETYLEENIETSGLFLVRILCEEIKADVNFQNDDGLTVQLRFKTE